MHLCFINSGCHRRHGKLPSSARAPSFCDQLLQSIEVTFVLFALRDADPSEWRDVRSVQHDHNVTIATLTDEQLFAIASGRASEIQVIEHEPAPGLGTGLGTEPKE